MLNSLTSFACAQLLLLAIATHLGLPLLLAAEGAQVSVGIEHDLSKPTFGLQGPTASQMTYDERNGLNLKGTVNDLLGPPIKIANGFQNVMTGNGMAGLGAASKVGGAVLGFDAKLLETAGLGHLLKGGLLMGGAMAKTGAATAVAGLPGKKISSIIEVPVKVVALKDLAAGKAMAGLGVMKELEAMSAKQKGATLIRDGEALKSKGYEQVRQGANEGLQNLNNMFQQTSGNVASAFKLLPLVLDMPQQQQQQQQQIEQQAPGGPNHKGTGLFGGSSPFDPLLSVLSGAANNNGQQQHHALPQLGLFGPHHNGFAAVLNSSSPLTNLLTNQNLNPFLMPISAGSAGPLAAGPLGQSMFGKPGPLSASNNLLPMLAGQLSGNPPPVQSTYSWFPGVKVTESSHSTLPTMSNTFLNSPSIFRDPQHFLQVNQQSINKEASNQQAPIQQQQQVQELIQQQTQQLEGVKQQQEQHVQQQQQQSTASEAPKS